MSLNAYLNYYYFLVAAYRRDLALAAADAATGPSNRAAKKSLFASASPALSSDLSSSTGIHKPSLRPPETGAFFFMLFCFVFDYRIGIVPIYDGRERQLKVPDELRNVPGVLFRYPGDILFHSLVLVAYTVSLYRPAQGARKDELTVTLNISFAVVLHDEPLEIHSSDDGEDQQDGDTIDDNDDEAANNRSDGVSQDQSAEEAEDQSDVEVEDAAAGC